MTKFKYKTITRPYHPNACKAGWVYEHRYFMELELGRYLKKGEVVHHIDGNSKNNDITNLKLCNNYKEHKEQHYGETDKRICLLCKSNKTNIRKDKYKIPRWYRYDIGYICARCYRKRIYWENKIRKN